MKKFMMLAVLAFVASLFFGCQQASVFEDPLVGLWVHVEDRAAGTIVSVSKKKTGYEGKVIQVAGSLITRFEAGDIKWLDLKKISGNEYRGKDLYKIGGPYDLQPEYRDTTITLEKDGYIRNRLLAAQNDSSEQVWVKLVPESLD